MKHRRKFLHLAAGVAALPVVSNIARAQTYPWRPVRIIVGFTAGSATDITARLFAQKLNEAWNVPVTVENIPGAGGSVGAERVAKSAPDGSTFYWGANGAMRRHGGNRRTAEQRDEFPPPHSITSSASESTSGGMESPSALAVLRLITSSNLVDVSTGRSAGFAPLRIFAV